MHIVFTNLREFGTVRKQPDRDMPQFTESYWRKAFTPFMTDKTVIFWEDEQPKPFRKKTLSPQGRKMISDAQKRRWSKS